jgi:hypothetical protein
MAACHILCNFFRLISLPEQRNISCCRYTNNTENKFSIGTYNYNNKKIKYQSGSLAILLPFCQTWKHIPPATGAMKEHETRSIRFAC